MSLSLDSKIVAVDFLFACIECYEFGVEEVTSVGKDRNEVGRGRGGQLVVCVIEAELGADFGEVAGDAVASAVVGEFGGLDVSRGPRLYIIEDVCDAFSRATCIGEVGVYDGLHLGHC